MKFLSIDHVQLAIPRGEEDRARVFFKALGFSEVAKPTDLAKRGGAWFESGSVRIHVGVETDFRPALKAHPALLVDDLADVLRACRQNGYKILDGEPLEGYQRAYVYDPFGNRIEVMQRC